MFSMLMGEYREYKHPYAFCTYTITKRISKDGVKHEKYLHVANEATQKDCMIPNTII